MFTNTVVFSGLAQAVTQLHHMKKVVACLQRAKQCPEEKKKIWWFN
jgi:hypothetical protein